MDAEFRRKNEIVEFENCGALYFKFLKDNKY